MEVFKTYLGVTFPGTEWTSDAELVALKNVVGAKEMAFEVGGLRPGFGWLYLAAHGGNGDVSGYYAYGTVPHNMTNVGACS
jgi:hypothetical protein